MLSLNRNFYIFVVEKQSTAKLGKMNNIIIYLLVLNVATFLTYGIDKWKAKNAKWRIREAALMLLAVLGGSIGAWLGMKVWHHKTLHKKFKYGIPAIIIVHLVILGFVLLRFYK